MSLAFKLISGEFDGRIGINDSPRKWNCYEISSILRPLNNQPRGLIPVSVVFLPLPKVAQYSFCPLFYLPDKIFIFFVVYYFFQWETLFPYSGKTTTSSRSYPHVNKRSLCCINLVQPYPCFCRPRVLCPSYWIDSEGYSIGSCLSFGTDHRTGKRKSRLPLTAILLFLAEDIQVLLTQIPAHSSFSPTLVSIWGKLFFLLENLQKIVLNIEPYKGHLRQSSGEVSEGAGNTFQELAKYHEKLPEPRFLELFFSHSTTSSS